MIIHLNNKGEEFWPSRYGYPRKNFSLNLSEKQLIQLKQEAFSRSLVPNPVMDSIINKTLASGVCSGISCYTLGKFYGEIFPEGDSQFLIALLQARTWGRDFLRQAIYSYLLPREKVLQRIFEGINSCAQKSPVLLVLLPRVLYLKDITLAHTVLPFRWKEGLENIYLGIYDSNYPGNDEKTLVYNKFTHRWQYDGKNNGQWIITTNYPENLTRKVPFLI